MSIQLYFLFRKYYRRDTFLRGVISLKVSSLHLYAIAHLVATYETLANPRLTFHWPSATDAFCYFLKFLLHKISARLFL